MPTVKINIIPVPQTGHICKPTALAAIEKYYAEKLKFDAIPLNKRNNPLHLHKKHPISIRELAKMHGSIQGELLKVQQIVDILDQIGYSSHIINFQDNFDRFKTTVTENIAAGNLIFACFIVDRGVSDARFAGRPTTRFTDPITRNEHAAVIHGYDSENDTIYITQSGKEWTCTFLEFYNSSMALLDTRQPEYYENIKNSPSSQRYKYDLFKEQSDQALEDKDHQIKKSITPEENSGFRGKLIVIESPQLDYIIAARAQLIKEQPALRFNDVQRPSAKLKLPNTHDSQIKHFAHVFLDGEINSTPLEGSIFSELLCYVDDFFDFLKTNLEFSDPLHVIIRKLASAPSQEQPDFLLMLQEQLSTLQQIEEQKEHIRVRFHGKKDTTLADIKGELTTIAEYILNVLEERRSIFFHGGWSGSPGHSLMYRLSIQRNGTYFCVYNARDTTHESTMLSDKVRHYPIFAFNIPSSIDKQRISQFLVTLLEFQIVPRIINTTFIAEDLYQVLHTAPQWFKTTPLSPGKLSEPVSQQRSGTCVWRAIQHWLQAVIPEHGHYRQFLLAYRLYSFNRIVSSTTFSISLPGVNVVLKRGLANMVRMLDPQLKKDVAGWLLHEKDTSEIITQITQWKIALESNKPKRNYRVIGSPPKQPEPLTVNPLFEYQLKLTRAKNREYSTPVDMSFNKLEDKSFDNALNLFNQWIQAPYLDKSIYITCLEEFCFYFTNRENPIRFKNVPVELDEQQELITLLSTILDHYCTCNPKPTAYSVIILLSLINIVDRLGQDKIFHFGERSLSNFPLYGKFMSGWIEKISHNPFLSTFNPRLDCLWERIRGFYTPHATTESPLNYYCKLIEQANESEQKTLQDQWERISDERQSSLELITAIQVFFNFPGGRPLYYCYLNNNERTKISSYLPQLNQVFQLQIALETFLARSLQPIARLASVNTDNKAAILANLGVDISQKFIYLGSWTKKKIELQLESVLSTKECYLVLEPSLSQTTLQPAKTGQRTVNDVLLSSYINVPNSQETLYLSREFSQKNPTFVKNNYPLIQTASSSEEQLISLLYHLRMSPECQVVSVLNELLNHPTWLAQGEFESYIILSTFQPGSLLFALQSGGDVWAILKNLWHKNKEAHPVGAFFVLKLAAMISSYALDAAQHGLLILGKQELNHAMQWQQEMLDTVEQRLKDQPKDNHFNVLKELHYWRLSTRLNLTRQVSSDWERRFISSYWFSALFFSDFSEKDEQLRQNVLDKASSYISSVEAFAEKSLQAVKLLLNEHIDVYQHKIDIDLSQRLVKINGKCLGFLPRVIRNRPEFQELFGQQFNILATTESILIDDVVYEAYFWSLNDQLYRALFCPSKHDFILQKQHKQQWYTYMVPSKGMQQGYKFNQYAFAHPPALLEQMGYRIWLAARDLWMVVTAHNQQVLYTQEGKHCYAGSPQQNVICKFDNSDDIPRELIGLDDPQYIRVLYSDKGKSWHFERYNLTFVVDEKSNSYQTNDKCYTVHGQSTTFGSGLLLQHKPTGSYFLMMPVQPYYLLRDKQGNPIPLEARTHYLWSHDLSNHLIQKYHDENRTSQEFGWEYAGSERYVMFQLPSKEQEPIATSPQDELYLAYLYLAQDRPKKAIECLRRCVIQGTPEEMELLWWIVTKLPAGETTGVRSSRIIAVQILALSKMLQLHKQYSCWHTTAKQHNHVNYSNNMRYKEEQRMELLKFVDNLPTTLDYVYDSYDEMLNNIPSHLRLHPAEEKILLSYCIAAQRRAWPHNKEQPKVLSVQYLKHFPDMQSTAFYKTHYHVMATKHFPLHASRWFDDLMYLDRAQRAYFDISTPFDDQSVDALKLLHPYMDANTLLRHFAAYYMLARDSKDELVRADLKHFCETSISCYHRENDRHQKTNIVFVLVSEILWTVLHSPASFPLYYDKLDYNGQTVTILMNIAQKIQDCPTPEPRVLTFVDQYQAVKSANPYKKTQASKHPHHSEEAGPFTFPWSRFFEAIDSKQRRILEQFSQQQNFILEQLKTLSQGSLGSLKKNLVDLEAQCLQLQKDILVAQQEAYEDICRQQPLNASNPFKLEKNIVSTALYLTEQLIQSILKRRQAPGVAELGKSQIVPTIQTLLRGYPTLHNNAFQTMGILPDDMNTLAHALKTLLSLHDRQKRLAIIEAAFQKDISEPTPLTKKRLIEAIFHHKVPSSKSEAVFQYMNQLALRPEQQQFIKAIFSHPQETIPSLSKILQLAMGGGKTKIILPLWAYEIADGERLAIILIPGMSLRTNYSDLATTSLRSFNQKPYCLHFDRETPDDPASLQELYEIIDTVRNEKQYIVSTESTWQSLELKYLELLNLSAKIGLNKHNQQRIFWLGKLLTLVREKGVAAIDEAHALLRVKKALIYEVIEDKNTSNRKSIFIDPEIIKTTVDLYLWLSNHPKSILGYLENPDPIMEESEIKRLMHNYLESLCQATQDIHSPSWIKDLLVKSVSKDELFDYLSGVSPELPKFLSQEPKLKKQWLLLFVQFQTMLPLTLRRKLYEHYGPSLNSSNPFAIPYRANKVPTEFVFGNFMEAINYTTQMMLYVGLTETDLKALLIQWQEEAYLERREHGSKVSFTEQQFSLIFNGADFEPLLKNDLYDPILFKKLYDHGHHNPYLVSKAIERCLQRLTIAPTSISSDPINLVSQFNHVVALTGTPNNHHTFHQDIQMMYETTLGVDAQVRQYLITKSVPVEYEQPQNIETFIAAKIKENPAIRACIDYGGFFRGVDNFKAANLLATVCANYLPAIQYILFYQQNQLCAWNIRTKTLRPLPSTDPRKLYDLLQCTENQRFTYYDQEHTLGTDISQHEHAQGILTVDVVQGVVSQMLQAAMRMRGLSEKQSLIIVVNKPNLSLEDLFKELSENEDHRLEEEHFWAGLKKIHNIFRNDLLQRLLNQTNEGARHSLFQKSISFFFDEQTYDISLLYKRSEKQPTHIILNDIAQKKRALWAEIVDSTESTSLDDELKSVVDHTIKICSKTQRPHNFEAGREVQQQRQDETLKEQERLDEQNTAFIALRPLDCSWIATNNSAYLTSLNSVISSQYPDLSWQFSPNLYASPNFLYSYINQQYFYNAYTKPSIAILFIIHKNNTVDGVLICMEEAEQILKIVHSQDSPASPHYCLMTLNGFAYHSMPSLISESLYQDINELLSQAQFATGKIGALREKPLSDWFKDKPEEKIKFLEAISSFVNLDTQSLDCFYHRLMTITRYLQAWARSHQTAEAFLQQLLSKQVPQGIVDKIYHAITQLEATRSNIMKADNLSELPSHNFHGEIDQAVFFHSYQTSLQWIKICTGKKVSDAIDFYVKNHRFIDSNCFDYYFPEVIDISGALEDAHTIHRILSHSAVQHFFSIFTYETPISREMLVLNFEDYETILNVLHKSSIKDPNAARIILNHQDLVNSHSDLLIFVLKMAPLEDLQQLFTNFERLITFFEFLFKEGIQGKTLVSNIITGDPKEIERVSRRLISNKDVLERMFKRPNYLLSEFSLLELEMALDNVEIVEPAINKLCENGQQDPRLILILVKIININPNILLEDLIDELRILLYDLDEKFEAINYFLPLFSFEGVSIAGIPTSDYLAHSDALNYLYQASLENPTKKEAFEIVLIFFSERKGRKGYIRDFSSILEEYDQIINLNSKLNDYFYKSLYATEKETYQRFKLTQFKEYVQTETNSFFPTYTKEEDQILSSIINLLNRETAQIELPPLPTGNLKTKIENWLIKNTFSISQMYQQDISSADSFLILIATNFMGNQRERDHEITGSLCQHAI